MKLVLPMILAAAALSGCSQTLSRQEGVTAYAGDAIAANTAMQIVDPWMYGVQDTKLKTPAVRPAAAASSAAASSPSSSTTSSNP